MPVFREDPYGSYNFEVVLTNVSDDGTAVKGSFAECSGLEVEVTPIDYRNGSEDIRVRKITGLKKFNHITLKRGIIGDLTFWNWIRQAMVGTVQRVDGAIVMLNEAREEVLRWTFKRAWPSKWSGPSFNAKNNEIAMETLEISHEGLDIDGEA